MVYIDFDSIANSLSDCLFRSVSLHRHAFFLNNTWDDIKCMGFPERIRILLYKDKMLFTRLRFILVYSSSAMTQQVAMYSEPTGLVLHFWALNIFCWTNTRLILGLQPMFSSTSNWSITVCRATIIQDLFFWVYRFLSKRSALLYLHANDHVIVQFVATFTNLD